MNKTPLSHKPQNQAILAYLRNYPRAGLSVGECCDMGMGTELRKRLSELRREGYIFGEDVEKNKFGEGTHKRYYLKIEPEAVAA